MNTIIAKIIEKMNGKSRYYLIAAVLITLLVFAVLLWYILYFSVPKPEIEEDITAKLREAKRAKIVKQLEELNRQKEEIPPLSEQEIKKQLKELNK